MAPQRLWGGGSSPQNLYFPNDNTEAAETAAVNSIARMDRIEYYHYQSTPNFMEYLIAQYQYPISMASEQGATASYEYVGNTEKYRNLQLAYFLRNSRFVLGMPTLVSPLGIYFNPFKDAEAVYADIGAMLTSWEGDKGNVFVLIGNDAGFFYSFKEGSAGFNSEASAGIETGRYDAIGIDPKDFRVNDLDGPYSKVYGSLSIPYTVIGSIGSGVSWSKINDTYTIIGTSVSLSLGKSVLGAFGFGYQRWGRFTITN